MVAARGGRRGGRPAASASPAATPGGFIDATITFDYSANAPAFREPYLTRSPITDKPGEYNDYAQVSGVLRYNDSGFTHADITRVEFSFSGDDAKDWTFDLGDGKTQDIRILDNQDKATKEDFAAHFRAGLGTSSFTAIYPKRTSAPDEDKTVALTVKIWSGHKEKLVASATTEVIRTVKDVVVR